MSVESELDARIAYKKRFLSSKLSSLAKFAIISPMILTFLHLIGIPTVFVSPSTSRIEGNPLLNTIDLV